MEEIDRIIPGKFKDLEKKSRIYCNRIRAILENEDFIAKIQQIRLKFNIPHNGIKQFRRIEEPEVNRLLTDSIKIAEKINYKKFINCISLIHNNVDLKKINCPTNSKKFIFQKEITKILKFSDLPERFRNLLTQYVLFNKLILISNYSFPCAVVIYKDGNKKRLFIELYGDTKREHVREAWKAVKSRRNIYLTSIKDSNLQRKYVVTIDNKKRNINIEIFRNTQKNHVDSIWGEINKLISENKLPGGQLFRYRNYYPLKFNRKNFTDELSYDVKNLYKWRHNRYVNKYIKA